MLYNDMVYPFMRADNPRCRLTLMGADYYIDPVEWDMHKLSKISWDYACSVDKATIVFYGFKYPVDVNLFNQAHANWAKQREVQ